LFTWLFFPVLGSKMLHPPFATLGGVYTIGFVSSMVHSPFISPFVQEPTVQGDSEVAALIPDPMDPELVRHVGHRVLRVRLLRDDLHRSSRLVAALGEVVPRLGQVAAQDLHEAVRVAVVVDGTALAGRPYEDELIRSHAC
jgi:hypothetical protein